MGWWIGGLVGWLATGLVDWLVGYWMVAWFVSELVILWVGFSVYGSDGSLLVWLIGDLV